MLISIMMTIFFISCRDDESASTKELNDSKINFISKELVKAYEALENKAFLEQINAKGQYKVKKPPFSETLCGKSDLKNIYEYNGEHGPTQEFVLGHATPVGAICSSNQQNGLSKYCSGTLISENLFLTASHCIDNQSIGQYVAFNYQLTSPNTLGQQFFFKIIEIVEQGYQDYIDYAIIKLEGAPGKQFGFTSLSISEPNIGDLVTIIQHPAGRPKQVEAGKFIFSFERWISYEDLDTEEGSSGSGILNSKGEIVGVHTNGGCDPYSGGGANNGMNIKAIISNSSTIKELLNIK